MSALDVKCMLVVWLSVSRSHLKVAEEGCASGGLVVGCCLRPQQLKRPPCRLLSSSGGVGQPRLLSLPTASRYVD